MRRRGEERGGEGKGEERGGKGRGGEGRRWKGNTAIEHQSIILIVSLVSRD